jgi:hypothetical protein
MRKLNIYLWFRQSKLVLELSMEILDIYVNSVRELWHLDRCHPLHQPILLKFIESKITREAKDRLLAGTERNTGEQIRAILKENYSVRRTLEYYASLLFTIRQGMTETVAQWGLSIDNMGTDLMREANLESRK